MALKVIIIAILAIGALSVLFAMYKSRHFFKSLFFTAFQGFISMLAVNVLGLVTGVTIAVNWYSLAAVALFGIPSTIALTIMDFLLR